MPAEQPMSASEIREAFGKALQSGGLWSEAIGSAVLRILDNIAAREAHDAEIAALKAQIGELGKRMEDDGR